MATSGTGFSDRALSAKSGIPQMSNTPKAAPTFLNGSGSYVSLSRAETVTPESGAGGKPSRASARWTLLSPASRLSRADLVDANMAKAVTTEDTQILSAVNSAEYGCDFVSGHLPRPPPCRTRLRPNEHRRRKYRNPHGSIGNSTASSSRQVSVGEEHLEERARAPIPYNAAHWGTNLDETEVLCEGPLEQRSFFLFWTQRWCIIDRREFRIYAHEEASLLAPERPLERYSVLNISMAPDLHAQSVLVVVGISGEPLVFLRTGAGLRREELVSSSLWLAAFAASARYSASMRAAKNQTRTNF